MFGHRDDQSQDSNDEPQETVHEDQAQQATVEPEQVQPDQDQAPAADDSAASASAWQHPGTPIDDTPADPAPVDTPVDDTLVDTGPQPISDVITPDGSTPAEPAMQPFIAPPTSYNESPVPNELLGIKQKALSQLSPLVDHLEQPAEEKFRTLMMMIQASDDQSLLNQAYETAELIEDEKVRAQAMLDIVSEINYFTAHPQN